MVKTSHDLCEYHAELAENQEEIKLSQVRIELHLEGMRGTAKVVKWLVGGCCGFLAVIAAGVWVYGWNLGMTAQQNRSNIERLMSSVIELRQTDKEICEKLTAVQREQDRMAGAKASGRGE